MTKKYINPSNVHEPIYHYSHAVVIDRTIFISAQLPLNQFGELVSPGDPAQQAEQVFINLKNVLEAAGGKINDVVKLTTYLTKPEFRPIVMEIRNKYFGSHRAPSILAVVRELAFAGALIEVDGIAVLD